MKASALPVRRGERERKRGAKRSRDGGWGRTKRCGQRCCTALRARCWKCDSERDRHCCRGPPPVESARAEVNGARQRVTRSATSHQRILGGTTYGVRCMLAETQAEL